MKKFAAACTTVIVLSGSAVFGSVMVANADDEVPTTDSSITEVVTPTEPVVEVPEVVVPEETLPSAARVAAPFVAYEESARWLLPASWPKGTTPTYQEAIFPQTELLTAPGCNRWSQDDIYQIDNAEEQALFDSLNDDGILTMGEDGSIYKSHVFTYGGDCGPGVITVAWPTPNPGSCNTEGWLDFTGEPAQNPNGVERDGYHLYINTTVVDGKVGPGTYTLTAYRIGSAGTPAYPYGTKLVDSDHPTGVNSLTKVITVPGFNRELCGHIEVCPTDSARATSTNLNPDGWSLKPARAADGTAAWVDGGLKLDASDGTGSAWAIKTLPAGTHLSDIGDLTTTFVGGHGVYWGGIILEGGDLTAQLHYDDNGRFWTTQSGIFAQDRAGYYQSFPIVDGADVVDHTPVLLSDPIVGSIKIYVNSGQSVTVATQAYLCGEQPFDFENAVVGIPTQYSADPIGPDCLTAGSLGDIVEGVFEHVNVTVTDNEDGTYFVEAETDDGYEFPDGSTYKSRTVEVFGATGFQNENPEAPCFQLIVADPEGPTFVDACGTANDTVTLPEDTEFVTYDSVDARDENGVGRVSVLAELVNDEDTFPEGAITEWTFDFTNVACPTTVVDVPPSLVVTGTDALLPIGLGAGALVLGLGAFLFARKRKLVVED